MTLPQTTGATVFAVRCADSGGRRVEIAVGGYGDAPNNVLTVAGSAVATQAFDTIRAAAPTPGGILLAVGDEATSLLHVRPDATRTAAVLPRVHLETDDSLAVSPDGMTAAIAGHVDSWPSPLLTLDLRTGRQLGAWTERPAVTGLAWAGPDRLLLRAEQRDHSGPAAAHVFDRTLTRLGKHPVTTGIWGNHFGAVGRSGVLYGNGARLETVPESGHPLVAASLRLAAAAHVVGVPGREFAPGATAPIVPDVPGEDGAVRVVVAALGTLVVLRVLAGLALVRRRKRIAA